MPPANKKKPSIWILADDRAGNRAQCLGVADALGLEHKVKEITYGSWSALPNFLLGATFAGLSPDGESILKAPWPDLVIAAGRRTAPVARKIKRLSGGQCFLVQIMNPGAGERDFGLIARPSHDEAVGGDNVIRITGAPHRITPGILEKAASRWRERIGDLPKPWIALIVGGSTRRRRFTEAMARELGNRASKMAEDAGGSLLVTTSRRSGSEGETLIDAIHAPKRIFRWGGGNDRENPYHGYLALADAVIVTGDSVSMVSEACAGTGPVYIFAPPALTVPKHARLHAVLYNKDYAKPFDGSFEKWSHPPLNPASEIAAAIRERLEL